MSFFLPLLLAALPAPLPSAAQDPLHADSLAADLDFLADDALQGRASAAWGGHAAARFLATRFEQIGLEPVDEKWLHALSVKPLRLDLEATYLQLDRHRFSAGRGLVPHPSAPEGTVSGTLVWGGFGIDMQETTGPSCLKVHGSIVLIQRYAPNLRKGERLAQNTLLRAKVQRLEALGAIAVLVADEPPTGFGDNDGHAAGAVFWPQLSATSRIVASQLDQAASKEHLFSSNLDLASATDLLLLEKQNHAPLGVSIPVAYVSRTVVSQLAEGSQISLSIKHHWQAESIAFNVVGMLQGSDPTLKSEILVLGAHYDHLGKNAQGEIWNGADDNASGVAVLLGLAEHFQAEAHRLSRSMVFVAFSGEEKALSGAHAFLNQRTVELESITLMMNFEMVGRLHEASFGLIGSRSGRGLENLLVQLGAPEGWDIKQNHHVYFDRSDQAPFQQLGIPTLHFTGAEHEDYHRPSDSKEKVNYSSMEVIARYAASIVHAIAEKNTRPTFVDNFNLRQLIFEEAPKQRGFHPLPFRQHLAY